MKENMPEEESKPSPEKDKKKSSFSKGSILAIIFGVLLLALASFCAYLLGQNQAIQNSQKQVAIPTQAVQPTISVSPSVSVTTPSPTVQPVTIQIDSEPNLPVQDVAEIKTRNINPFVDWSTDQNSGGGLVLIKVTTNADTTYPYKFEYVYKNGGNGGFLIKRTSGHLDWYMPDCLGSCNFTPQFKQKYPEIVSKY